MSTPPQPSASPSPSDLRAALEARLRFYKELGIGAFYGQPASPEIIAALGVTPAKTVQQPAAPPAARPAATGQGIATPSTAPSPARPAHSSSQQPPALFAGSQPQEDPAIARKAPVNYIPDPAPAVPPAEHFAALKVIRETIGDCTRCKLAPTRNKLVFGDGDPNASLMFVGEGPGADEDAQGIPFVGRGGQLLNNMIAAMGLKREQVYIANVVKCRPPQNRTPEPDEAHTCAPFLFNQIDVVRPKVIVALGQTAVSYLTAERRPLAAWRGVTHPFRNGSKLIVTYHPAFLLRDPNQKKHAWADLQIAMRELGLQPPQRKA
ncbi:MAG TPA: uracil-DNA glycosylase [Acidobacteriaceae bacterium]